MSADGDFGTNVKGAVVTFQKENSLGETGKVDSETAKLIKKFRSQNNYKRPGIQNNTYSIKFYQLPPSKDYNHYGVQYDSNRIMFDVWGRKKLIKMLQDSAKSWKEDGKNNFLIGDLSAYDSTGLGHGSDSNADLNKRNHCNGGGVDLDSDRYCSINKSAFNKEDSLALANKLIEKGATRIIFNCKYVIDKCKKNNVNKVMAWGGHHHHFHVDTIATSISSDEDEECLDCVQYDTCDYEDKAERSDDE